MGSFRRAARAENIPSESTKPVISRALAQEGPWAVEVSLCSFDSRHWIRGPVNWPNMYQRDPQHWDNRSGPNGKKYNISAPKKEGKIGPYAN